MQMETHEKATSEQTDDRADRDDSSPQRVGSFHANVPKVKLTLIGKSYQEPDVAPGNGIMVDV